MDLLFSFWNKENNKIITRQWGAREHTRKHTLIYKSYILSYLEFWLQKDNNSYSIWNMETTIMASLIYIYIFNLP